MSLFNFYGDHFRKFIGVKFQDLLPDLLKKRLPGLYKQDILTLGMDLILPFIDRCYPGDYVYTGGKTALYQGISYTAACFLIGNG